MSLNTVQQIVFPVIDEINETLSEGEVLEKSPETILFGEGALLDSIGLVNFIVTTERIVEEETGKSITLASEKAFSRRQSPFRTVATLAEYIEELLKEED